MFKNTFQAIREKLGVYWGYLIIFVSFLLILSLVKNIIKTGEVRKEIAKEKDKVERLKTENERLKRETQEVESQAFIEKQLRDKLGLARKGEVVLVLPDEETLQKLAPQIPQEEETLPDPNWKRWLNLFL